MAATMAVALVSVGFAGCDDGPDGDIELPEEAIASCVYTNQFSNMEECKDYLGANWTEDSAENDCLGQQDSTFTGGEGCAYEKVLGGCALDAGSDDVVRLVFPGEDEDSCTSLQRGCELFGGGAFLDIGLCSGESDAYSGGIGSGGSVFTPPELMCMDPIDGEAPGEAEGGQVCTWSMISGCTEEGRKFNDYASCDAVLTQRPYWAAPPDSVTAEDDPRLADEAYMAEVKWVKDQAESCGCICCHDSDISPQGASNWDTAAPGIWTDTFYPTGLAMGAGWVDSSALGAYPPEDNHGFSRVEAGLPSTDEARMIAFFEGELERRGYTRDDFADMQPFGGPIYTQSIYEPEACENGEGVAADGTMSWVGGAARYVYVLEGDADNPGAPPNFDLPEGTLWRLDVAPTDEPLAGGFAYGETPSGATQRFPEGGEPTALVEGETYYIYALADLGIPVTRCLFTYGE